MTKSLRVTYNNFLKKTHQILIPMIQKNTLPNQHKTTFILTICLVLLSSLLIPAISYGQSVQITSPDPLPIDTCSGLPITLGATATGPVAWRVLGNVGTFSDSLSNTPDYTPQEVTTVLPRLDTIIALLDEGYPAVWDTIVGIDTTGSMLTDTVGGLEFSGVESVNILASGANGWVETKVPTPIPEAAFGLSLASQNPDNNHISIDYAILFSTSNGQAIVEEDGIDMAFAPLNSGDIFRIEKIGNTILYLRNRVVFHQTNLGTTIPDLKVDVSLLNQGETLDTIDVNFGDASQPIIADTLIIRTHRPISLDLGMDLQVCEGDSVQLMPVTLIGGLLDAFVTDSGAVNQAPVDLSTNYFYVPDVPVNSASKIDTVIAQTKISDTGECPAVSDTILVTVLQKDSIKIVSADMREACEADTVYFNADPFRGGIGKNINWQLLPGLGTGIINYLSADSSEITYMPAVNASVTVATNRVDTLVAFVNSSNGCEIAKDTAFVQVRKAPTITAIADQTMCILDTIELSTTPGLSTSTIIWQSKSGGDFSADPDLGDTMYFYMGGAISPAISTVDSVRFIANSIYPSVCEAVSDSFQITIFDSLHVSIDDAPSKAICQNDTLTLRGAISNINIGVTWTMKDPSLGTINSPNDTTNATYIANPFTGTITTRTDTIYLISNPNGLCPRDTAMLEVLVRRPPEITAIANQIMCTTDTIELSTTLGPAAGVIMWESKMGDFRADPDPGDTMYFYTGTVSPALSVLDTVRFTASGIFGVCDAVSDSLEITVFDTLNVTIDGNASRFICQDDSLTLNGAISNINVGVTWTMKDPSLGIINRPNDTTGAAYIPNAFTGTDITRTDTIYLISDTNGACPRDTAMVRVFVRRPPEITTIAHQTMCTTDTIELSTTPGPATSTIAWLSKTGAGDFRADPDLGDTMYFYTGTVSPALSALDTVRFTANGIFGVCDAVSDSFQITVFDTLNVSIDGNASRAVCQDDSLTLNGVISNINVGVTWTMKDPSLGMINRPNDTTGAAYMPIAFTGTDITRTDTIYLISDANGACPRDTAMVRVFVRRPPEITAIANQTMCTTDTIELSTMLGPATDTIAWLSKTGMGGFRADPDPGDTMYFYTGTVSPALSALDTVRFTANGIFDVCDAVSDSFQITVFDTLNVSIDGNASRFICQDDSLTLNGAISNINVGVTWTMKDPSLGMINRPNDTTRAAYIPNAFTGTDITRTDTIYLISDANGACPRDTAMIRVFVRRPTSISAVADQTICEGDSIRVFATPGGSADTVLWMPLNGLGHFNPANGIADTVYYIPDGTLTALTRFDSVLLVTDNTYNVCPPTRDSFRVTVLQADDIAVTPDSVDICESSSTTLTATINGGASAVNWQLHPNNASNGTLSNTTGLNTTYTPVNISNTDTLRRDTILAISSNTGGCKPDTVEVEVIVHLSTTLSMVQDTFVCGGDSVLLATMPIGPPSATIGGWQVLSSTGTMTAPTSLSSFYKPNILTSTNTRVDTIRYFSNTPPVACPVFEDTLLVTVFPNPVLSITDFGNNTNDLDTVMVCEGDSIAITATANAGVPGVLWTSNSGTFTRADTLNTYYTPNTGQTVDIRYDTLFLIPTVSTGCTPVQDTLIVIVQRAPLISVESDTITCEESPITLDAMSLGFGDSIFWNVISGGTLSAGFSTNANNTVVYTPSTTVVGPRVDTIQYASQIPLPVCAQAIDTILVNIESSSTILIEANDPTQSRDTLLACEGLAIQIDGSYGGTATGATWSVLNSAGTLTNIINDTIATYTPSITGTLRTDTLLITAQIPGTFTCPTVSDTLFVIVEVTPTVTATQDSIRMCQGDAFNLSGTFSAEANNLAWSEKVSGFGTFSNTTGSSTTYTPSGTVSGVFREDIIYLTSVNNTATCPTVMDSIHVFIAAPPSLELGNDTTICGESGLIIGQSAGAGNQVNWTSTNGTFAPQPSLTPTYTTFPNLLIPGGSRQDVLQATSVDTFNVCPAVSDTKIVTVLERAQILILDNTTICESDTLIIDTTFTGLPTSFSFSVQNNMGTAFTQNGGIVYVPFENTGEFTRIDTLIINNIDPDGAGVCMAESDTVVINILNEAKADLVGDTTICLGETIDLVVERFGTVDLFESKFSNSLINYPNLPVTLTNNITMDTVRYATSLINGCDADTGQVIVTIRNPETIAFELLDTSICSINTLSLNSGVLDPNLRHQWRLITGSGSGVFSNDTISNPIYTPTVDLSVATRVDQVVLDIVARDNICRATSDTMNITVTQNGSLSALRDTTICSDDNLSLSITVTGLAPTFSWSANNGTLSNPTDPLTVYSPNAVSASQRLDTVIANLSFPNATCADITESVLVTVVGSLELNAGVDTAICQNFGYTLNGTTNIGSQATTWSVLNNTGTLDNPSLLNAIYTPNSLTGTTARVDTLVLSSSGNSSCLNRADTVLITVKPDPTANLGVDQNIFDLQTVSLSVALSDKVETSFWRADNGTIPSSSIDIATYVPDIVTGTSPRLDTIFYEGVLLNQTCPNVTDFIVFTVESTPSISRTSNEVFCQSLCLDTAFLNLDVNTGSVVVLANDIDPLDTCAANTNFDFRIWHPSLNTPEPLNVMDFATLPSSTIFDCDDKGAQAVNVYVAQNTANVQLCPVVVNVEDAFAVCGERTVSGRITTFLGEPMVGVDIFIEDLSNVGGVVPAPVQTDANGDYSIVLPTGRDFRILPFKNDNPGEGVTAFDNVVISRHILGLESFDSPFQTIASDVNKSGTVTAFDIVLIRKVVLAREASFVNNTSWRFIDASFQFTDIANAANAAFMESFVIPSTTGNISGMDFIGVKIGDPNGTADPSAGLTSSEARNSFNNIQFEIADQSIESGKVYDVPFKLLNVNKVLSYQFTLNFDGLELLAIQEGKVGETHFGLDFLERGKLTTAWSTARPEQKGGNWFSIQFKAKTNGTLSELLSLESSITPIEANTIENKNIGVNLVYQQSPINQFRLYQNKPNPFKDETVISFSIPEMGAAKLTILDMNGKVIRELENNFQKGFNEITVDFENLPKGILYYRLETAFGTQMQKMMHLD